VVDIVGDIVHVVVVAITIATEGVDDVCSLNRLRFFLVLTVDPKFLHFSTSLFMLRKESIRDRGPR